MTARAFLSPALVDCTCASCNLIAEANRGARQLRAPALIDDDPDAPAAVPAGASSCPEATSENAHGL